MMGGSEKPLDRILIFGADQIGLRGLSDSLVNLLPAAEFTPVHSIDLYRQALAEREFDIVVVDYDIPEVRSIEFIAQLRLRDNEPDVLLVSECKDVDTLRLIARSKRRYVVRDDFWIESMAVALRDMLRIRKLETEMMTIRARLTEANALLEEKNKRLDEFCSTIAHDIRGPLAGLILKVEYILEAYEGELDDRCSGLLKKSLSSAERLVEIVQAMYEFAKIGTKAANNYEIPLHQLVTEVIHDLSFDESLEVKVGIGELPHVWGNSALLRRVFINLLNNAIKYNDKTEKVINIGCSGTVEKSLGRFAEIYVEDNGRGIPAEDIKHVFGMFRRGLNPGLPQDGLGVGLPVVQRIVELHFGKVKVDSVVGEGTRFTFLLPLEKIDLIN